MTSTTIYDVNNYARIVSKFDYPHSAGIRNIVAIPPTRPDPYCDVRIDNPVQVETDLRLKIGRQRFGLGRFDAGRYLFNVHFDNVTDVDSVQIGVEADGIQVLRYHTNSAFLSSSYSDFPVELPYACSVDFFVNVLTTELETTRIVGLDIARTSLAPRMETYLLSP